MLIGMAVAGGYKFAELNRNKFHGIGPFDKETGKVKASGGNKTYTGFLVMLW